MLISNAKHTGELEGDNHGVKLQHCCKALRSYQRYDYFDSLVKLQGSLRNTCFVSMFSNVSQFGMYIFDSADSEYGFKMDSTGIYIYDHRPCTAAKVRSSCIVLLKCCGTHAARY